MSDNFVNIWFDKGLKSAPIYEFTVIENGRSSAIYQANVFSDSSNDHFYTADGAHERRGKTTQIGALHPGQPRSGMIVLQVGGVSKNVKVTGPVFPPALRSLFNAAGIDIADLRRIGQNANAAFDNAQPH